MLPHVVDFLRDRRSRLMCGHRVHKAEKSAVTVGRLARFRSLDVPVTANASCIGVAAKAAAKPPNLLLFSCMSKLKAGLCSGL